MNGPLASLSTVQSHHVTLTLCNALWGHQLSFHPFVVGDPPVPFSSLWPSRKTLVETYREASLEEGAYELFKLLMVTGGMGGVEGLLESKAVPVDYVFEEEGVTLAHLACALGLGEAVQLLSRLNGPTNGVWALKDREDHSPHDVCFSQRLRPSVPTQRSLSLFRKKVQTGLPLREEERLRLFSLAAQPGSFYRVIVLLQMYLFDVNKECNSDGDLLIHLAVKGGLSSLPLIMALVFYFGADVETRGGCGLTPLCLASQAGHEHLMDVLICVMGAKINQPDFKEQRSPLHHAVENSHAHIVSLLLRRGADASCEDSSGCLPGFLAHRKRDHECKQIIRNHIAERAARLGTEASQGTLNVSRLYPSDVLQVTSEGCSLLMLAARNGHEATVKELLLRDNCPLDFRQMKVPSVLDSGSFSLSVSGDNEWIMIDTHTLKTAVHFVAEQGHSACLSALLTASAHPALTDVNGWLPLHYACDNGHLEAVQLLLAAPNNRGLNELQSAINIAKGSDFQDVVALVTEAQQRRQKVIVTPLLFEAALSGDMEQLCTTLQNGDNVNPIRDSYDWPLLLAAGYGYLELVTYLHQFGGHVTRRHRISGSTTLHVAARGGHMNVVRFLLPFCRPPVPTPTSTAALPSLTPSPDEERDFLDINEKNVAGATPLELAVSQGHSDVVRLLLEHGASGTLPDSNGQLLTVVTFGGTQFLIESNRKERAHRIYGALTEGRSLSVIKKLWQSPSDFNLQLVRRKDFHDSVLMVAAERAGPDVLQFLLNSAQACQPGMLIAQDRLASLPQSVDPSSLSDSERSDHSLPGAMAVTPPPRVRTYFFDSMEKHASTALPPEMRNSSRVKRERHHSLSDECGMSLPHRPKPRPGFTPIRLSGRSKAPRGGRNLFHPSQLSAIPDLPASASSSQLPSPPAQLPSSATAELATSSPQPGLPSSLPSSQPALSSSQLPALAPSPLPPLPSSPSSAPALPDFPHTFMPTFPLDPAPIDPAPLVGPLTPPTSSATDSDDDGPSIHRSSPTPPDDTSKLTTLTRLTSRMDGQTALHRAASACQYANVALLLQYDPELANMKDLKGNTALHVACSVGHKQTVKTLLSFEMVDSAAVNEKYELPETQCCKKSIKKLVCKHRTTSLPSPPVGIPRSASMAHHNTHSPAGPHRTASVPVSRSTLPSASTGGSSWQSRSEFDKEMRRLKERFKNIH